MGKKKKSGFAPGKIFLIVGAIGAAAGALVLAWLYFTAGAKKEKQADQDPADQDPADQDPDKTDQK